MFFVIKDKKRGVPEGKVRIYRFSRVHKLPGDGRRDMYFSYSGTCKFSDRFFFSSFQIAEM